MLRLGGLGVGALTTMRAVRTLALCDERRRLEGELQVAAGSLSDAIAAVVPLATGVAGRRGLVELRRDIFNGRTPDRRVVDAALSCLPTTVAASVVDWCDRRTVVERLSAEVGASYERELSAARVQLRASLRNRNLRRGIAVASRDLSAALARYVDTPVERQSTKQGKQEHSLVEYLSRAATKTSPFSSFTAVAPGRWTAHEGPLLAIDLFDDTLLSSIRPNSLLVQRLWEAYLSRPEVRRALRYRLHPSCVVGADRVVATVLTDDPVHSSRYFGTAEKVVRVPLLAPVRSVVDALRGAPDGTLDYHALAEAIASLDRRAAPEVGFRLLDQLITLRVLQPCLELPEQAPDPLAVAAIRAREVATPLSAHFALTLERIRDLIRAYGDADASIRAELTAAIHVEFKRAAETVEAQLPPAAPVLYEDTAARARRALASRPAWKQVLRDLRLVQDLQPLWDPLVRFKNAATAFFERRYGEAGRAEDLGAFLRELHSESEDWLRTWRLEEAGLGVGRELPDNDRLNQLLAEFKTEVTGALCSDTGEVALCRERLTRIAAQLPAHVRGRRASNTAFCQVAEGAARQLVVLNHVYAGTGRFFTRFLPLFGDDVTEEVRGMVSRSLEPGVTPLELPGVFGFNANLHPPIAPLELAYPGIVSARPPEQLVSLSDLCVEHDPERRVLRVVRRSTGGVLHPYYPGFLIPLLLPPTLRMLTLLFGDGGMYGMNPHGWTEQQQSDESRTRVRTYPRLLIGDVVIARRAWHLPEGGAPVPDATTSDREYFEAVLAWREQLRLPDRVFVRNLGAAHSVRTNPAEYWQTVLGAKPQFIEWSNPLLVRLFGKIMRASPRSRFQISEMLPDVHEWPVRQDAGPVVSELLVELDRPQVPMSKHGGAAHVA